MNEEQKKQFLDMDLYELFGVEESATIDQIKKAYRKRALESHPDKNPNNKEEAEKKFVLLGKALEVLGSEACKAAYDAVRKSRREKAKRDEMLNEKQRALKRSLEERERMANEKAKKMTEDMKKTNAEERYQKEVDRLRSEGSKLLEEEMDFINEQIRQEANKSNSGAKETETSQAEQLPARFKIKWPSKLDSETMNEDLLTYLFGKYGEVEALVMGKKSSAIVEYKRLNDAIECLNDEVNLKDKYSITLKWLGPDLSKPKTAEAPVHEVVEDFASFEEMEMAILKKMQQAAGSG